MNIQTTETISSKAKIASLNLALHLAIDSPIRHSMNIYERRSEYNGTP